MDLFPAVRGILSKPVVLFTTSRYLSYALLFLRGILIAKFLGPYYFGIWGFITLYHQYLSFTSMGIQYAVSTELAILEQNDTKRRDSLVNTAFTLTLLIAILVTLAAVVLQFLRIEIFGIEGSYKFIVLTFLIGALQHFRELFANIFRVYNDYWRIAIGEFLVAIITLVVVFFFEEENLIFFLMLSWVLSLAVSVVLFMVNTPFKLSISLDRKEVKLLLSVGLPLLVYSVSYYLMTLSSRTIISIFYDLDIVGYYTFANTITNATMLGLNAASWVFYPVLLSKMKEGTDEVELRKTIYRVNNLYGVAVVLTVYICIICAPLFYLFLEKYSPASTALNILLLSQAVLSLGFVFNTLAIARRKHRELALIGMATTLLSAALGVVFASFEMYFVWLTVATLVSFVVYTLIISRYGASILGIEDFSLFDFFPFTLQLSMLLFLVGSFTEYSLIFYISGLGLYSWTNRGNIRSIFMFILKHDTSKVGHHES